jgi:subtilisin family serine protease
MGISLADSRKENVQSVRRGHSGTLAFARAKRLSEVYMESLPYSFFLCSAGMIRRARNTVIVRLTLFTLFFSAIITAQIANPGVEQDTRVRVIVGFKNLKSSSTTLASRKLEIAAIRTRVLSRIGQTDFSVTHEWQTVGAMAGYVTARGLAKLASDPDVIGVSLDRRIHVQLDRSAPLIHAEDLHAHGFTGVGAPIAVLDSGVDVSHPDLVGSVVAEQCFCAGCCPGGGSQQSGPGSARDDNGHGTRVTGIIAAKGNVAAAGVAPQAGIVAVKIIDKNGNANDSDVISALQWIAANPGLGIRIVNLSAGSAQLYSGECDITNPNDMVIQAYATSIEVLRAQGVIVFAASGNEASSTQMGCPACISRAVSVGSVYSDDFGTLTFAGCTDHTTAVDQVACFSNSNSSLDLLAPGCQVTSARLGGGTTTVCGTSEAVPHAAGAAALLLSMNSGLTPDDIETRLKSTGTPVTDPRNNITFPRVDLSLSPDLIFESNRSGRFQIWKTRSNGLGVAEMVTTSGAGTQESRAGNWSVAVEQQYIGTPAHPKLGRIAYQFGAPGVRGIHLINADRTSDVKLTPVPSSTYPCTDARDPSWSADGRYVAYSCLVSSGNYDIWVHDTSNTPDNPSDDVDYSLLNSAGTLEFRPEWSPDQKMISFTTTARGPLCLAIIQRSLWSRSKTSMAKFKRQDHLSC